MRERGFTLIELLVVVGIMGMLAAIAVPQFMQYRKRAFDAAIQSDLRNAITAEQSYYVVEGSYTESVESLKSHGFRQSPDVNITIKAMDMDVTITGDAGKKCAPGTGIWMRSSSGYPEGTPCN